MCVYLPDSAVVATNIALYFHNLILGNVKMLFHIFLLLPMSFSTLLNSLPVSNNSSKRVFVNIATTNKPGVTVILNKSV